MHEQGNILKFNVKLTESKPRKFTFKQLARNIDLPIWWKGQPITKKGPLNFDIVVIQPSSQPFFSGLTYPKP